MSLRFAVSASASSSSSLKRPSAFDDDDDGPKKKAKTKAKAAEANDTDDEPIPLPPRATTTKTSSSSSSSSAPVPLLVANKVPGLDAFDTEDAKFRHDVSSRPEAPASSAYERVPVESFGKRLLMGMDWKPGQAIGGKNKALIKPIEYLARGKRLGLGAVQANKPAVGVAPGADGRVRHYRHIDEKLVPVPSRELAVGCDVDIHSGRHASLRGQIEELGDERVRVRLDLSGEVVTVARRDVRVATAAHDTKKKKKKKKKKKTKRRRHEKPPITWVVPGIRVRIVEKGSHYSKKGRVEDVVDLYSFTVVMADGALLEDLGQDDVETALPKAGGRVRMVQGKHRNRTGTLLERRGGKAVVQLDDGDVLHCSYDDVAESL